MARVARRRDCRSPALTRSAFFPLLQSLSRLRRQLPLHKGAFFSCSAPFPRFLFTGHLFSATRQSRGFRFAKTGRSREDRLLPVLYSPISTALSVTPLARCASRHTTMMPSSRTTCPRAPAYLSAPPVSAPIFFARCPPCRMAAPASLRRNPRGKCPPFPAGAAIPLFLQTKNKKPPPERKRLSGVPERIRTADLPLRRRTLYPAELRKHLLYPTTHRAKIQPRTAKSRRFFVAGAPDPPPPAPVGAPAHSREEGNRPHPSPATFCVQGYA